MTKRVEAEVAVVGNAEVVVAPAPAFKVEVEAQDMVLPFLKVIQPQADEVTRGKEKYNDNVRPGDIYDSVTRTVYTEPEIIVCGMRKYYGEWEGDVRGTLVAKHRADSDAVKKATKIQQISPKGTPYYDLQSEAGNRMEETFGVVCIVKNNGVSIPATFTLAKTAFTVGKTLSTLLTMYQTQGVPKFKFKTNTKQNDKGSWFVPVFEFAGYEDDAAIINMAANMSNVTDEILFKFSAGEIDTPPAENDDVV